MPNQTLDQRRPKCPMPERRGPKTRAADGLNRRQSGRGRARSKNRPRIRTRPNSGISVNGPNLTAYLRTGISINCRSSRMPEGRWIIPSTTRGTRPVAPFSALFPLRRRRRRFGNTRRSCTPVSRLKKTPLREHAPELHTPRGRSGEGALDGSNRSRKPAPVAAESVITTTRRKRPTKHLAAIASTQSPLPGKATPRRHVNRLF